MSGAGGWRLYADMGNSSLQWAAHTGQCWGPSAWTVVPAGTAHNAVFVVISSLLEAAGLPAEECGGAALVSSNPRMAQWAEELLAGFGLGCVAVMGRELHSELVIEYDDPSQMGQDRIAMMEGARELCGAPAVAISCGTCITAQALSADGRIVGGAIAPGLAPCRAGLMEAVPHLAEQTAEAARRIEAGEALPAVGHSTVENLAVGLRATLEGTVARLAEVMRAQVGESAPLVLTGGWAEMIAGRGGGRWRIEPLLGLEGLRALHERKLGER